MGHAHRGEPVVRLIKSRYQNSLAPRSGMGYLAYLMTRKCIGDQQDVDCQGFRRPLTPNYPSWQRLAYLSSARSMLADNTFACFGGYMTAEGLIGQIKNWPDTRVQMLESIVQRCRDAVSDALSRISDDAEHDALWTAEWKSRIILVLDE